MGEVSNRSNDVNAKHNAQDSQHCDSANIDSITDRQLSEQLEVSEFCLNAARKPDTSCDDQYNASGQ